MVLTGLTVILPNINTIVPFAPDSANEAHAEFDAGPDYSGADGHWEWNDMVWNEELVAGSGNDNEVPTDPHDILIIFDNIHYYANPNSHRNFYYNGFRLIVQDIHSVNLTVDSWTIYPYLGTTRTHQQGVYDQIDYFNYYPSLDVMNQYSTILIICNGPMYGGTYYEDDFDNPSTLQTTYSTLEDYMDGGGTVGVFSYSVRYYFTYDTSYLGSYGIHWVKNYLGIAKGTTLQSTYGFRGEGVVGTIGEDIGPTRYPDDRVFCYGYDRFPQLFNSNTEVAYKGNHGTRGSCTYPIGWQTDNGDWKSVLMFNPWYLYYRKGPDGYNYYPSIRDVTREPIVKQLMEFIIEPANEPPIADAGVDQSLEQESHAGTEVTLDGSGSYDPDEDSLTYAWSWTGGSAIGIYPKVTFPLGTTVVTLTVSDGDLTDTDAVEIVIVDTTPPDITYETDQIVLWPPNHKYHTIEISDGVASATDIGDEDVNINDIEIISCSSDEPENEKGKGDGDTTDDMKIIDSQTVKLRAERQGSGNGRVYSIYFMVTDRSDNCATGFFTIWVPHDLGKRSTAIDDGASSGYSVYS